MYSIGASVLCVDYLPLSLWWIILWSTIRTKYSLQNKFFVSFNYETMQVDPFWVSFSLSLWARIVLWLNTSRNLHCSSSTMQGHGTVAYQEACTAWLLLTDWWIGDDFPLHLIHRSDDSIQNSFLLYLLAFIFRWIKPSDDPFRNQKGVLCLKWLWPEACNLIKTNNLKPECIISDLLNQYCFIICSA